jgi:hypothetical protein
MHRSTNFSKMPRARLRPALVDDVGALHASVTRHRDQLPSRPADIQHRGQFLGRPAVSPPAVHPQPRPVAVDLDRRPPHGPALLGVERVIDHVAGGVLLEPAAGASPRLGAGAPRPPPPMRSATRATPGRSPRGPHPLDQVGLGSVGRRHDDVAGAVAQAACTAAGLLGTVEPTRPDRARRGGSVALTY